MAALALNECIKKANFGEVVVCTDKSGEFDDVDEHLFDRHEKEIRFVDVPNWPDKVSWSRFNWHDLSQYIRTPYVLTIQWDSWVWKPELWTDEFLKYDYVGAPWWYKDGRNVGNGGFNLRSTRLLRYVRNKRRFLPIDTPLDDDLFSRQYRALIEQDGYKWAPEKVARQFAFECTRPSPTSEHFGFHAAFNFGKVLPHADVLERARLMRDSPYITKASHIWKSFVDAHPGILEELTIQDHNCAAYAKKGGFGKFDVVMKARA